MRRALLLLPLLLAGFACKDDPVTFAPNARYIALGSSFASGAGIATETTDCRRSDHSYPHLVAASLTLELVDATCAGATTADVVAALDAVTAETKLVTLTVGGNDIGYNASADACARPTTCTVDHSAISTLAASLTTLIDAIRGAAPDATIVLVTYPRIVPAEPCAALSFATAEATAVADLGVALQYTFLSVADQKKIRIADAYAASAGHGPCAAADARWIDGATVAEPALPFHPTAAGHAAMSALVLDALDGG